MTVVNATELRIKTAQLVNFTCIFASHSVLMKHKHFFPSCGSDTTCDLAPTVCSVPGSGSAHRYKSMDSPTHGHTQHVLTHTGVLIS